jgi:ABC-type multidrug transport system fused ATPase/permease subunit
MTGTHVYHKTIYYSPILTCSASKEILMNWKQCISVVEFVPLDLFGCYRNKKRILFLQVLIQSKTTINVGEIMELVCNDTQCLVTMADRAFPYLVRKTISAVIYISWILFLYGWTIVPGLLLFFFVSLFRILVTRLDLNLRQNASRVAEERLGYLREVITSIHSIKLSCLEHIYENKIKNTRW